MTMEAQRSSLSKRGFTITEVMVAMVIMVIVIAQLMLVMTTQNRTYSAQARMLDAQQDARLSLELVLSDLRMAGFMIPTIAGISSRDGGPNAPDTLCMSDPTVISEASLAAASARFDRARVTAALGGSASTVTLLASSMDIDSDGNDDFTEGNGVIISAGAGSHCARITDITANVLTFTPQTPAGFAAGLLNTRVVPAVIYEVAGGLSRNSVLLSPLVENLQIEFGVDANSNGQIDAGEFPIYSLAAVDPSDVITARVTMIARTEVEQLHFTGAGMPPSANHVGGPADGFKRRRITARVSPRNMQ